MNQKIIVFEGHDKSGKSTIAKALSAKIDIPLFKVQRDKHNWCPEHNLKYGTEQITQFLEQTGASVILDRWHPSDYMYSKLFNRKLDLKTIKDIDSRLSRLHTLIVYCYKQPSAYEPDPEDAAFISEQDYPQMNELYNKFDGLHSECIALWLDTTDRNLDSQLNKIISLL